MTKGKLARHLGFFSLIVYAIGDILGAGIYALVGKVIETAGSGAWASFLIAAVTAALTGMSYAELTARFPVSGGAAAYVRRAFPGKLIATLIGTLVLGTGLVSAATVTVAFGGYLKQLIPVPSVVSQILLIGFMSFLSFWGIRESARLNLFLTLIEFFGLMAVVIVGASIIDSQSLKSFAESVTSEFSLLPVFTGVTIAFYAYIGFEDLANLAEEAKNPVRDIPRAILIAIAFTSVIYLLVTLVLIINVPREMIGRSETPLLLVFHRAGFEQMTGYFAIVAMMAIANTGLINMIMASRLLYGMSNEGLLPPFLSRIHTGRQTPWVGVVATFLLLIVLTFTGGLKVLAQTTSLLILLVFLMVHASLLRVKWRKEPHHGISFPILIPLIGSIFCLVLIAPFPGEVFLRGSLVLALGFIIWLASKAWRKYRH